MSIATRVGRMVTYLHGLLPISSLDPSIKWPCEITWQIKHVLSPLALD